MAKTTIELTLDTDDPQEVVRRVNETAQQFDTLANATVTDVEGVDKEAPAVEATPVTPLSEMSDEEFAAELERRAAEAEKEAPPSA